MPEQQDEEKSRSRKKRESTALQQAGEKLARLSPAEWAALHLPEDLVLALANLRRMRTREARRRQMQYIGRLMREAERDEAKRREKSESSGSNQHKSPTDTVGAG